MHQHEAFFTTVGVGQLWVNHYGHALFALPNQAKTTITHPSNLLYDDDVDSEPVDDDSGEDDGGSDDDDDVEEAPRVHGDRRHAPSGPSSVPRSAADGTSSGAMGPSMFQTVLDRLEQLQVQNQEILRNQQNMAHLVHYAY